MTLALRSALPVEESSRFSLGERTTAVGSTTARRVVSKCALSIKERLEAVSSVCYNFNRINETIKEK